jgi:hypothetical protein
VLSKPVFAKAFGQCAEIVSLYQEQVLKRLQAAEASATSKSDQQTIRDRTSKLAAKKHEASEIACLKQFLASLGVGESATGHYADELGVLNGSLSNNKIDLARAARAKVDDLTEQGLIQLGLKTGLGHLPVRDLQSEIDSVGQHASGGYLACLLPKEWVDASPDGYSACHGLILERKAAEIAALLKSQ